MFCMEFRSNVVNCLSSLHVDVNVCKINLIQIVSKQVFNFVVVWHFIDMFSISLVVSYEVIQFENFICAINAKWMSNQQMYDTNANAVWFSTNTFEGRKKYRCSNSKNTFEGGKNTIHFLPPFDQICKVDERDIHLRRRKNIFVQLWHFVILSLSRLVLWRFSKSCQHEKPL